MIPLLLVILIIIIIIIPEPAARAARLCGVVVGSMFYID